MKTCIRFHTTQQPLYSGILLQPCTLCFAVPADLRQRYEAAGQGHVFAFLDAGKVRQGSQRCVVAI